MGEVDGGEGDGINFDFESGIEGYMYSFEDGFYFSPSGEGVEHGGIDGIEGDIDSFYAGKDEILCIFVELCGICGEGEFVEGGVLHHISEAVEEEHDVSSYEGFSAGDSDFVDTEFDEDA